MLDVSIIVPTYNEAPNVAELVRRVAVATCNLEAEVIFVDDSSDETPDVVRAVARSSSLPVRLIHRDIATNGLSGAVLEGMRAACSDICVVMDGDLQHPPEEIPRLLARHAHGDADVVVASRYTAGGSAVGLAGAVRSGVSRASTAVTKAMFPVRLRGCSDPMTGYFLIDRSRIDLTGLRPRGFKILLEILARQSLAVREIPFSFAERFAGRSKASMREGVRFLWQLAELRFGKMSAFAAVGGLGAVANLLIMAFLTGVGGNYVDAAIIAAELTIVGNFLMLEHFVFRDLIATASSIWSRFAKSFTFNNVEALVRIPVLYALVETSHISSVLAAALTLLVAFIARFVFHSLVVYGPRRSAVPAADLAPVPAAGRSDLAG